MSASDLSILFFLQLAVILIAIRIVGYGVRFIGQPQVVGEMIAGVVLGPSLFGLFFPELFHLVFPADSRSILFSVAQVGLALYMFMVGMEFRAEHFQHRGKTAVSVSVTGMISPFLVGVVLATWLFWAGGFFPEKVNWYTAALFMGASMCITAFPMLARIIVENKLAGTALGTLALAAGAIDDVAAWCILAIVVAQSNGVWSSAVLAIAGGAAYALVVLTVVRRMLVWLKPTAEANGGVTSVQFSFILALVCFGAFVTDIIGIYAVFGGFLMGCAMPRGIVVESVRRKIEPLTVSLLLPLFFTYSGLNTRLDLIFTPWMLFVSLVVILGATFGKGVACWAAARICGEPPASSIAMGALMNARGLMELILLNIGREAGVVGNELFSILVVMAIATTLGATPVYKWLEKSVIREQNEIDTIKVPVDQPSSSPHPVGT